MGYAHPSPGEDSGVGRWLDRWSDNHHTERGQAGQAIHRQQTQMMETIKDFWFWHKENILLTAAAGIVFAIAYEITALAIKRIFREK